MQLDFTTLLTTSDTSLWQSPLLPDRFWSKVNPFGPTPEHCPELSQCWVWTACCNPDGYGRFGVGSRSDGTALAHRHIYTVLVAPIPAGHHVLHHCDNPPCVRPGHLFLGTQAENNADMTAKGRNRTARGERNGKYTHPERTARGERVGSAKLTETKVLEMRRLARAGMTKQAIASQFEVSDGLVGQIVRRKIWRHV